MVLCGSSLWWLRDLFPSERKVVRVASYNPLGLWTNNKYSIYPTLCTGNRFDQFCNSLQFWDYRPEGTTTLTITTGTVHTPPFREQPMPPQIFDWRLLIIIVSPWRSRLSISNSMYTEVYLHTLTRGLLCDFSLQWYCGYRFSFWDLLGVC